MKQIIYILTFFALLAVSCQSDKVNVDKPDNEYFVETNLSFFDPYNTDYTYSTWIRNPANIRIAHETFKKIGYKNLVDSSQLYQSPCMLWGYVNRPCSDLMDSLLITYQLDTIETKYYREFWDRRKKENNDKAVFNALTEISALLLHDGSVEHDNELVNDTLYKLVMMDRVQTNPTDQQAKKDFDFLKDIGLNYSAYNLLYESYGYEDINWDREELAKGLRKDTVNCCPNPWIMDGTK